MVAQVMFRSGVVGLLGSAGIIAVFLQMEGSPSRFPGLSIATANRLDIQGTIPIQPGDTVLVGDSIFELAAGVLPYRNHGISGDTIAGTLARIGPVLESPAERIVLQVGINDLQAGREPDPKPLMDVLCASGKHVVWLAAVPPNPETYRREILSRSDVVMPTKEAVEAYNARLAAIACPTVKFQPLDGLLADGVLRAEYTIDGLHLNGAGLREMSRHFR